MTSQGIAQILIDELITDNPAEFTKTTIQVEESSDTGVRAKVLDFVDGKYKVFDVTVKFVGISDGIQIKA